MVLNRRHFLLFLGAGAGSVALGTLTQCSRAPLQSESIPRTGSQPSFQPVRGPMPLPTDGLTVDQQIQTYSRFTVVDDLVLPEGYTYGVIAAWGDPVGNARFGFNNDYLSFVETSEGEGYLTINFEYISTGAWVQAYEPVLNQSLPLEAMFTAAQTAGQTGIDAYTLAESEPLKEQIRAIAREALTDQGIGVIAIRRDEQGRWVRTNAKADRRISGISGLEDGHYLNVTGPGKVIFQKTSGQGYIDGLGDRIIGTFGNCAGGTTPWGTVLSAEENFQDQVAEPVFADGTAFDPGTRPFDPNSLEGQGNVLGLAGNKYGWIVEVDPTNPNDYGTKHTWLGRYRHEAVGIRVEAGQPLAFYSGCDRRGGHLYKFVSREPVRNPQDKANSRLLENGTLYAAQLNPDGTGRWIALNAETPVDPSLPSQIVGGTLTLPQRPAGGYFAARDDQSVQQFKQQFQALGDLYEGTPDEKQGAILIDAHYAANAAGATATARPEDTMIGQEGALFITFTSGSPDKNGGPDQRIFQGPDGETPYEYGWIMRLTEDDNVPAATNCRWEMLALGGEPADGGAGFCNPDNLTVDANGNLWMVTDMSTSTHNKAIPDRQGDIDKRGLFGNNSIWLLPTSGPNAGQAYLFGMGPTECETTGPFFTSDQKTLFLAVQHPGEANGSRQNNASETRQFAMLTTDGQEFMQTREVPIGSNWPGKSVNDPPKPAVVAIYRVDQQPLVGA